MHLNIRAAHLLSLCFGIIAFPAQAAESVRLQLNGTHSFEYAGYYAAQEKGFYRDAGLDVELQEKNTPQGPTAVVTGGQAQFGVGNSGLILARAAGKPVVVLAVIFQHSPLALYTATSISNPHQLAGSTTLLGPQSSELLAYLRFLGVPPGHIQQQETSPGSQDLGGGKIQAMCGLVWRTPEQLQSANIDYHSFSPHDLGMDFYGDNLFTTEQEIRNHPHRVEAFLKASLQGWRYASEHPREVAELIQKNHAPGSSLISLQLEAARIIPLLQTDIYDIGHSSPARWQQIAEIYANANMMPHRQPLNNFIYDPQSSKDTWLYRGVGLALALLLLVSVTALFIFRINRKLTLSIRKMEGLHQQEQARGHAMELLAKDAPLAEVLAAIVKCVEAEEQGSLCSILLMDEDGKHLHVAAAPSLPFFYNQAIDNLEIGFNVGSCGTTAYLGKRTIVSNILEHPSWADYKELAAEAGLGSCWSEPILSSSGKVLGTFAIYHHTPHQPGDQDIERIERAANLAQIAIETSYTKQALLSSDKLLSKISAEVPGIIFQLRRHPDGRYSFPFISEAVRKMYGLAPEQLRKDATAFFQLKHPDDAGHLMESVETSAQNLARWHIEYRVILPGQGTRWRLADAQPEKFDDGSTLWHGIISDITERKQTDERIQHMAQYDALTDLPNRALFSDRLQRALAAAKRNRTRFALLFLDFDKFKPINDTLGHAVGDILLQRAAGRMQRCMRESDTIARIGGDEFVVLLPLIENQQDTTFAAEKIRMAIEQPFEIEGHELEISCSIGIAIYPQHGENEIDLSKHADIAMYYAKQGGRNTVVIYHHGMHEIVQ